jgi:ribosome recycling factor
MMEALKKTLATKMDSTVSALQDDLKRVHTGRAHPSLIEHLSVDVYGVSTPLKQLSSIHAAEARTLAINVWDKNNIEAIEKAIMTANLGLNPRTHGSSIHVPVPALTQERRQAMVKLVSQAIEQSKVSLRNVRREAMQSIKTWLKEKEISEDERKRFEHQVQEMTDDYTRKVEQLFVLKEKELMAV